MVEERFAKMEEYGEDWDDKPVSWTIALVYPLLRLHGRFTERFAHVAHDGGQGSGEVHRRHCPAIARSQLCRHTFDVFGKC